MRIHTDLSAMHIIQAVQAVNIPGVAIMKIEKKGSRSRKHRFDIALSGHSITGGAYGNVNYQTATWDEWGMAIEAIFQKDPKAIVGPYRDHDDFRDVTMNRFDDLEPADMCKRHRWDPQGHYMFYCKRCGAEHFNKRGSERWQAELAKREGESVFA